MRVWEVVAVESDIHRLDHLLRSSNLEFTK
jgi:hypothetical protein